MMSTESRHTEDLTRVSNAAGGDDNTDKDEFLIIENGDKMMKEVEKVYDHFRDQTLMFSRELDCLWRLMKDFMRLAGPTLLCLVSLLLTRFVIPKDFQPVVLSSLLGCAVATILVYSAPFMISFHKYRNIRHVRVKKLADILQSNVTTDKDPEMLDSNTQTNDNDPQPSNSSTDTEVETIANPSSSGSSVSEANEVSSQPSIELIGLPESNDVKNPCKKTDACAT